MFDIHLQKLVQWVYCPGHARVKGNDLADTLVDRTATTMACISKISTVEGLETLLSDTKPKTSHHRSPGGERHTGKKWHSTVILETTREDHLQSN